MFYSHTFLARKGPLGTVWCAAHLQHKLKKSHYTSTNIPSTVERIMYPEVPIALRMSGHLLLGVVRIYSKQVDYLYEDCNVIRITINRVFTSVSVNLPEDATHAPFHSVTLPQKFELDSLNLDEYYKDWGEDSHLKSRDDITLTEQIPTGQDPYIVITFDEHDLGTSSFVEDNSRSGPAPMEEDVPPPVEVDTSPGFQYPSPSNNLGADERTIENSSPRDLPSIEVMRGATHGLEFNNSPILPDRADPDEFLEEQINKDKETSTPVTEEVVLPDAHYSSSHKHGEQPSFGHLASPMLFVHRSPEMEIRGTPPIAEPKVRRRKRKQHFDESTVLSNQYMKNALNDTNGIRRVKKNCPSTSLTIWKVNNRLKKDEVFLEPFITGCSADLRDMYKENFISSKPHLVNTEETHKETNVAQSPISKPDNNETEIEILRNNEYASPDRYMPSVSTLVPSPYARSCFTPENNSNFGLQSERLETSEGDSMLPNTDMGASSGNLDSEIRTPDTFYGKGHTALSDIPELLASPGELGFLEQDDNSPAESQGTPECGIPSKNQGTPELQALSSRTRAVAQYLKKQLSVTPILGNSDESSGDLSLNKILQGKSRKISARMFSETLVLKNYGLVDVHQVSPYNDITLKVTPKLSKGEFSI